MRYENEICQGCGKIMHEGEDIVVCPECGTPQHRECYNAEHKCVNEHLHEDGYTWRAKHGKEEDAEAAGAENGEKTVLCPFCQHENTAGARECANCGQPFELFGKSILPDRKAPFGESSAKEEYSYRPPFEVEEPEVSSNAYHAPVSDSAEESFVFNGQPLRGEIDGIENKDMALYLRTNVAAYHEKFRKLQNGKSTFNWAAFFFMPYWFFYRKLVKPGIIFMSLTLLLSVVFYNPMMEYMDTAYSVASQISSAVSAAEAEGNGGTEAAADQSEAGAQLTEALEKMEELTAPILAYAGLTILLRIIAGIIADRMYKKKAVADIREINGRLSGGLNEQQEKFLAYTKQGGISVGYAAIAYGAEYLMGMLISGIMTGML